ncbi:uncharacterized protein MKK02DRAFT_18941 [Dioszegia hungarica]|uniref:Uncharacterized protein n=1 Tax=Dioszegia hungarica TaxID=4972 RepID=A0AA38HFS3_9TREE|nr:uncharacterized protein MKK02DRAFT_18941 [Dioszegia hungarica]KAI9639865.1 hypothetical protein MKK02DRAFT_18941 [Dioszegia hungarica]
MSHFDLGQPIGGGGHSSGSSSSELHSAPVLVEAAEAKPLPPPPSQPVPVAHPVPAQVPQQQYQQAPPVQQTPYQQPQHPDVISDSHPSTADNSGGAHPATSTIDPNVPSSMSAPTALPTGPDTNPSEQKEAMKKTGPKAAAREVEKTKGAEREIKGEPVGGTIVKGVEDDRLYAMLRRFDVDITHVLHPASKLPSTEPDLRISLLPNLPSHSEVIKSNLERLIAAVGPSSVRGAREMGRLMSWSPEERARTASYALSYFICWAFGYAVVGVFVFGAVVMCFPMTRRMLFPPIPPAPYTPPSATDPTNQKGDESLLGTTDSAAAHRSKAEQAEEQAFEARSILQAFTTRLVFDGSKKGRNAGNAQVGEKVLDTSDSESDDADDSDVLAPAGNADGSKPHGQGEESADIVIGGEKIKHDSKKTEKQKKKAAQAAAKKKRDELVSKMTKGTQDGLGAAADMIERLTNALSPPTCYPDRLARFKMAGAFLIPPALLFHFVPAWVFGRAATFLFGVGMFAQPVLIRVGKEVVARLPPNWQELVDIRNSILSGVPTDAQLTLHLLRVAESLDNPLPRAPAAPLEGSPKEAIKDTSPEKVTEDDDAEIEQAINEGSKAEEIMVKAKVKTKSHVLGAFKGIGKKMAGFRGDVAVDGEQKVVSSSLRCNRIGAKIDKTVFQGGAEDTGEIDSFPAKLNGTSGYIILESRNDILPAPQVSFVAASGTGKEHFVWPIDDIVEIKKSHVTATRLALGWVSGAEIEGLGLTIRFKTRKQLIIDQNKTSAEGRLDGTTFEFTKVARREQLFVRLVSMGAQRWEVL